MEKNDSRRGAEAQRAIRDWDAGRVDKCCKRIPRLRARGPPLVWAGMLQMTFGILAGKQTRAVALQQPETGAALSPKRGA